MALFLRSRFFWPMAMVRRKAVFSATRALRCRVWHEIRVVYCGLWPMVRRLGGIYPALPPALRALCGAVSGTRYVSMRGLKGSRRVPPT
eukprot:2425424-Prymnesium_polylepis.1